MNAALPPRPDRDAVLDALQDQLDELNAALAAQQRLIDAHSRVIVELARIAGLGASQPDRGGHGDTAVSGPALPNTWR